MKLNIEILLTITIICLFSSCFLGDIGAEPEIIFKTYWSNNEITSNKNEIIIKNDTLNFEDIKFVITDLKFINNKKTIFISDYNLIDDYETITLDNTYGGVYQISFNFGIQNLDADYPGLQSFDFETEKGYYFMKMKFSNKKNDSIYNYNIAKKDHLSKVKYFNITIDGYNLGGGLFVNQAKIGINLKNLFTKPNYINIDSLTLGSINNEELQLKMMENAKNIFFLDDFIYD